MLNHWIASFHNATTARVSAFLNIILYHHLDSKPSPVVVSHNVVFSGARDRQSRGRQQAWGGAHWEGHQQQGAGPTTTLDEAAADRLPSTSKKRLTGSDATTLIRLHARRDCSHPCGPSRRGRRTSRAVAPPQPPAAAPWPAMWRPFAIQEVMRPAVKDRPSQERPPRAAARPAHEQYWHAWVGVRSSKDGGRMSDQR
jgi:hypothetical protein